jgi:outer membrane protein assembly factor BamB
MRRGINRMMFRTGVILVLALSLTAPLPARAEDWPMIQKDAKHSGSIASGPAAPLKQAWRATPGDSESNFTTWPVLYEGVVYASSGPGVLAVDARTGEHKWFESPDEGQKIVAPAVDASGVYVPVGDNTLIALDRVDGQEMWRFAAVGNLRSSPTVSEGFIYIGSAEGNTLYCIEAQSGKLVWESVQATNQETYTVPVVADGLVVFSTMDLSSPEAFLVALKADTGEEVWRTPQFESTSSPAILNDKVIVGTGESEVAAFELQTGRPVWTTPIGNLVARESSPATAFGDVFVADRVGNFYRLDGETGKQEWHVMADEGTFNQSYPVIAGTTLYIGGGAGWLHAIDVNTGKDLWKHQVGGYIHSGAADSERFYFGVKFRNEGIYAYEHDPDKRLIEERQPGSSGDGPMRLIPWIASLFLLVGAALVFRRRST